MNKLTNYGKWAFVLGATDGIGKCFCQYFAQNQLNVVLVGRRKEKMDALAAELRAQYKVGTKVVQQDLTADDAFENLVASVDSVDIGIFNYVATYHQMGRYWQIPYEEIQKVININVNTYAKLLHHFGQVFTRKGRGAIVTMSSLTAVSASPYNSIYGAAKAFEMVLTEGVAYELQQKGIDVIVSTASSTKTPDWMKNQPDDPAAVAAAMTPEDVVSGTMAQLGTVRSAFPGAQVEKDYYSIIGAPSRDEAAKTMASYYEEEYK